MYSSIPRLLITDPPILFFCFPILLFFAYRVCLPIFFVVYPSFLLFTYFCCCLPIFVVYLSFLCLFTYLFVVYLFFLLLFTCLFFCCYHSNFLLVTSPPLLSQAPGEAEAQCAAMVRTGKVYGTASEDMDCLTFGSTIQLRHLTASEAK